MIGYLKGVLASKMPPHVVVDCHGVGYEVDVPMSTMYQLPDIGQTVLLRIHFVIREDAHLLFGFLTEDERSFFRQLLKVNGVGTRLALAVLSAMTRDQFMDAVLAQDVALLKSIPGVGVRLAERLSLEMKNFCSSARQAVNVVPTQQFSDVSYALLSLGYSSKEVTAVMAKMSSFSDVSEGIKMALRHLSVR